MAKITDSRIVRSRRRTLALVITPDARLEIRAPLRMPAEFIKAFIDKKSLWISRKLAEVSARPKPPVIEFTDGEEFLYLGSAYRLSIVDDADLPFSFERGFRLARPHQAFAKELFVQWYRQEALITIKERLALRSSSSGIRYNSFSITSARSRWGSCSGNGDLRFSWRLMMAPLHVVDYVIAHELAHINRKDHSKEFWKRVADLFPGYGESAKWLKGNGHLLTGIL
ncbi:MAG: SprT family zinc-dependent metalloprotease [Candidatus Omnitrophica bacterium]|nr:SprT family zinc-dependent metalloprotease [Candidatus Omnitrophota bacterium]